MQGTPLKVLLCFLHNKKKTLTLTKPHGFIYRNRRYAGPQFSPVFLIFSAVFNQCFLSQFPAKVPSSCKQNNFLDKLAVAQNSKASVELLSVFSALVLGLGCSDMP